MLDATRFGSNQAFFDVTSLSKFCFGLIEPSRVCVDDSQLFASARESFLVSSTAAVLLNQRLKNG